MMFKLPRLFALQKSTPSENYRVDTIIPSFIHLLLFSIMTRNFRELADKRL
ncbi:hypothetical protein DEU40_1311, partial [Chryseobacterium sp. AG844]